MTEPPTSSAPDRTQPAASATQRAADQPGAGRVSRRALLIGGVGAAGLVVGAGAGVTATALSQSDSAATGPHVASPGEELMVEHGVLKRLLLAYRAIHDRLLSEHTAADHTASDHTVTGEIVTDTAALIADYVEGFHEGLEEGYVFPRIAHRQPDLVRTLLVQHDRGRHLTAAIQTAATGELTAASARRALAADLAAFVRMYEPHEAWEDTVIYPTLRQITAQRTLDELAERFADLQNQEYGDAALATILDRVAGIEEQLGIGDLAAFTPPAPR